MGVSIFMPFNETNNLDYSQKYLNVDDEDYHLFMSFGNTEIAPQYYYNHLSPINSISTDPIWNFEQFDMPLDILIFIFLTLFLLVLLMNFFMFL